jgi:hypothetical protein
MSPSSHVSSELAHTLLVAAVLSRLAVVQASEQELWAQKQQVKQLQAVSF